MRIAARTAALALALLAAACAPLSRPPGDIVWSGKVLVKGVETVPRGKTLIIRPGTRVRFAFHDEDADGWGDAGIVVLGRILAQGTTENPIVFEPQAQDSRPGRWGEIRLDSAETSRFAHCRFRGSRWGVHAHFTSLRIEQSSFNGNVVGMKFRGGPVELYGNRFFGNATAIRYWESDPEIISNIIRDNATGVFCRVGSQRTLMRGNNFVGNLDYHVKLGELQDGDIDARYNYWGSTEPEQIGAKIYDREDVSYLGGVLYDPFETEAFPLDKVWRKKRKEPWP